VHPSDAKPSAIRDKEKSPIALFSEFIALCRIYNMLIENQ
jgi:hypothetical protein